MRKFYILYLVLFLVGGLTAQDPSNSFGNTFIHSEGNMTVFGEHRFELPAMMMGSQPGVVGGEREPTKGYFSFAQDASWVEANDGKFIDGYVRHFGSSSFLFPIGDNGVYRPAAVSGGSYTEACYYGVNPTIAITDDIRGGNFPVLPGTGPFNSNIYEDIVIKVSEYELSLIHI